MSSSIEHKVVAADESSNEIAAVAAEGEAWRCRSSQIVAPARLESGQVNGNDIRIDGQGRLKLAVSVALGFADRVAATRATGASIRTAGRRRSGSVMQVSSNTNGGVNANKVLIVDDDYLRKDEKRRSE
ncbi:hypothetical protein Syun_023406 [Stephania yunnanensis]|uniref:Uncharacterized protein n=1 Tax=Stephania yunnanensis TaxID=152371 RepID=A0AAP0F8W1_9MAGN